jgi:integrase
VYNTLSKLEKAKELLRNNEDISKINRDLMEDYIQFRRLENLNEQTILRYYNRFKMISEKFNNGFQLNKATKKEVNELVLKINESNLCLNTKAEDLGLIVSFYRNFLKNPNLVEDIKIKRETKKRAPSEILTEDDILNMINTTSSVRDKCIISVLGDSGLRVGELINLKVKNVSYTDDNLIQLMVETGKTGGRRVLLIPSVPHLSNWLNHHPFKDDGESWLFPSLDHKNYLKQMTHASINVMLHKIAKKINLRKAVNPHAFRRYSATQSSNYMSDTTLMIRYGWTKRDTVSRYTFLNPKEADDSYRRGFGKKEIEVKESKLQPIKCICKTLNASGSDFCVNCGRPLNLRVVIKNQSEKEIAWNLLNEILDDELKQVIKRKLQEKINT